MKKFFKGCSTFKLEQFYWKGVFRIPENLWIHKNNVESEEKIEFSLLLYMCWSCNWGIPDKLDFIVFELALKLATNEQWRKTIVSFESQLVETSTLKSIKKS